MYSGRRQVSPKRQRFFSPLGLTPATLTQARDSGCEVGEVEGGLVGVWCACTPVLCVCTCVRALVAQT